MLKLMKDRTKKKDKPAIKVDASKSADYYLVSGGSSGDEEELFDDCPICQVMKKAKEEGREPTMEELQSAFTNADTQQNPAKL